MIESFADQGTRDVYDGIDFKRARRTYAQQLWPIARRKLDLLDAAGALEDLRSPPGNQLEALRGDRLGQHSVRINQQYRVCFIWRTSGPVRVEIADYH